MAEKIDIALILPHPENSNRMDAETLTKLRRHIERAGRYEPLIVRPHPTETGRFQLINGHHRLQVLKVLKQKRVECTVWDVDDKQTRLYLATLNRLAGEDIPERRTLLIGNLLESFTLDDLAELLPEDREQLAEIGRLSRIELDALAPSVQLPEPGGGTVILEFFLDEAGAKEVNLALDLATHRRADTRPRSDALLCVAQTYLAAKAENPTDPS